MVLIDLEECLVIKRTDLITGVLFLIIVGFSFLSLPNNQVSGQTTSSSSGSLICTNDNNCPGGICPDGFTYQNFSCLNGACNQLQFFADPCLMHYSSSSSGSTEISLNKNFTGVWKARVRPAECIACIQVVTECTNGQTLLPQTCTECAHCVGSSSSTSGSGTITNVLAQTIKSSRIITLKLCVKNGKLEGIVHQGGVIDKGSIISQNIISQNEVIVTIQDKGGKTETLDLKLQSNKFLSGSFASGKIFQAKRVSSGSLNNCSSKASCRGPNGTYLPCPEGTECSGLPAYGCYPPGCPVPICLSLDTKIRMPNAQKRVADIKVGDLVLTDNEKAVKVIRTSKVEVKNHIILQVTFNDARVLEISPNHPTGDGRLFKSLKVGDIVDDRMVVRIKTVPYNFKYTYDILPDSDTGNYYANGILIGSTLAKHNIKPQ